MFLGRTVMQPLLLIFVFTYVFPKIGQAIGGAGGAAEFSTLLVGGVIASAMIFQGVQAVALPLVQDFGYTREIEDRVLAPMPVWAVAVEKVASGAIQARARVARGVPARARSSRRRRCTSRCTGSYLVTLLPLARGDERGARAHDRHAGRAAAGAVDLQPARDPDDVPRRGLLPVDRASRRCRG